MNHTDLFERLKIHYTSLNPHHDTWVLWNKDEKTDDEFFEVAIGTILVQNTNWKNVNQAIANLRSANIFTFEQMYTCAADILVSLIRPAGFFNQKQLYLKSISQLFLEFKKSEINREVLLQTKGIGKETADSILNFCLRRPVPVIGTYTKRFFARISGDLKYLSKKYEFIQEEILAKFNEISAYNLGLYHALIVAHSQNVCTKKNPDCPKCFLQEQCSYSKSKREMNTFHVILDERINLVKKKS